MQGDLEKPLEVSEQPLPAMDVYDQQLAATCPAESADVPQYAVAHPFPGGKDLGAAAVGCDLS